MTLIIRIAAVALLASALAHVAGSFTSFPLGSSVLVWSLSGACLAALLAVLSWILSARSGDRALQAVTIVGLLAWAGFAFAFGLSVGNALDPRALAHLVLALLLTACLAARPRAQGFGPTFQAELAERGIKTSY